MPKLMQRIHTSSKSKSANATSPEADFLLGCLRVYFQTDKHSTTPASFPTQINWQKLLQLATTYAVVPLLYQSLKIHASRNPPTMVPASVLTALAEQVRRNGLENFSKAKMLLDLLQLLAQEGVTAIPFKGAALAVSAYGNLALRQFSDLDLLVTQAQFWQAKDRLVAAGYEVCIEGLLTEFGFAQGCLQLPLKHQTQNLSVDLHWSIPPQRSWTRDRCQCLWQNLVSIELMGQPIRTFSPEATLVIQCMNAAKEPWAQPLKQLCDIAQVIGVTPTLDWERVWQLAGELRSQRLLLIGLAQAQQLLQVSLPTIMQERIRQSAIALKMADQIEQWIFATESRVNLASLRQHIQYFFLEWLHQIRTMENVRDFPFVCFHFLRQASYSRW